MTYSIQFFVRNVPELLNGEHNTYPLITFETRDIAYDFIRLLRAEHTSEMAGTGCLILNNPQLLPNNVRSQHQYTIAKMSDDPENDRLDYTVNDGCFNIERNIVLLNSVIDKIDNNNMDCADRDRSSPGFREFIQTHSRNCI